MKLLPQLLPMLASEALTIVLSYVFFTRENARRAFPLFGWYVIYSIAAGAVRIATLPVYEFFFYTFWLTEAAYLVLIAMCMYRVFSDCFTGMLLLPSFRLAYPTLCIVVAAYAWWKAYLRPPIEEDMLLTSIFISVEIGAQYLLAGTFLLFELASRWLRISYFHHSRILMGFGLSSIGMLIGVLVRSEFGTRFSLISRYSSVVAYLVALIIWISAFRTPFADPAQPEEIDSRAALHELQQYNSVLRKTGRWNS